MSDDVRVGAVDCGTNSIRLLVADIDPASRTLVDIRRRMEIVRLGHGVDRTGVISDESMKRTLDMTRTYAAECRQLGASRVRFVATSASRDARNAATFVEGVRSAFHDLWGADVVPEVVSGDEEASLSFSGATGGLSAHGVAGPYLVVDIGGGSTEFVRGTSHLEAARSVDVGCVRMTERHLHTDPPTPDEVAAATADVDRAIEEASATVPLAGVRALVGLAGSVTTITAHALRLPRSDPAAIHLSQLPVEQLTRACTELLSMSRAERAALPYMHPGRVDVIGAGALVWRRVLERVSDTAGVAEAITSEHDILDGIALSIA